MKKDETKFKERVQRDLNKLNNVWFVKIQQVSIRGIPDFLMCVNGGFIALELKRSEDAERHKLQEWTLQSISHAGGMSFISWPDNWEETFAVIQSLDEKVDRDRQEEWETSH